MAIQNTDTFKEHRSHFMKHIPVHDLHLPVYLVLYYSPECTSPPSSSIPVHTVSITSTGHPPQRTLTQSTCGYQQKATTRDRLEKDHHTAMSRGSVINYTLPIMHQGVLSSCVPSLHHLLLLQPSVPTLSRCCFPISPLTSPSEACVKQGERSSQIR